MAGRDLASRNPKRRGDESATLGPRDRRQQRGELKTRWPGARSVGHVLSASAHVTHQSDTKVAMTDGPLSVPQMGHAVLEETF